MRGRGLKLFIKAPASRLVWVALHAGAWIETRYSVKDVLGSAVALHAGAWIETSPIVPLASRSSKVALHAGAWIETGGFKPLVSVLLQSPSMRGRGLKPTRSLWVVVQTMSPSMRGRGLKLCGACDIF